MPIINYTDERVQLEFGYGDIRISHGTVGDAGAICFFRTDEITPIGTKFDFDTPLEVPAEDTPVRMTFEKEESIDVLINALLDAKRLMIHKRNTIEVPVNLIEENSSKND